MNIAGVGPGGRTPGQLAVTIALVIVIISFGLFLFSKTPVDDRDEPLPLGGSTFRAVYLDARSILTGEEVAAENVSIFEAYGPAVIAYGLIPLAIVITVFVLFRRSPSSRPLTIGMLAMAAVMFFVPGAVSLYFMLALITLAVGSFQARRAEIPLRMAERAAEDDSADADDEDEYDEEDEYDDEDLDDEEYDEDEDLDDEEDEYDEDDEDEDLEDDEDEDLDDEEIVDEDEDLLEEDVDADEEVEDEPAGGSARGDSNR